MHVCRAVDSVWLFPLSPQNLIVQSQSGSGKTAAFVLAMLRRIDASQRYPQVGTEILLTEWSVIYDAHPLPPSLLLRPSTCAQLLILPCKLTRSWNKWEGSYQASNALVPSTVTNVSGNCSRGHHCLLICASDPVQLCKDRWPVSRLWWAPPG